MVVFLLGLRSIMASIMFSAAFKVLFSSTALKEINRDLSTASTIAGWFFIILSSIIKTVFSVLNTFFINEKPD
jgi:hypothetical protein